jgi:5-aminopentanamidase
MVVIRGAAVKCAVPLASGPAPVYPSAREDGVKITVACGQFAPEASAPRNAGRIAAMARDAAARGAALLVLPELCLCGYLEPGQAREAAVAAGELRGLGETARKNDIALCLGFAERSAEGALFNSMACLGRDGRLLSVYRKVHLWTTEKAWAQPGSSFQGFDAHGLRAGMWICYDTRFPEAVRSLALDGVTLGVAGSAWFGPAEEWELALRARALDNGIFAAGAAVQGSFGAQPFHGESLIVDPHGCVLARAREGREEIIFADYDDAAVASFRARLPLLDHRRPETYA